MSLILVVDDDTQLASSFKKLLGEEGYEVLTAADAESGIEAARDSRPDLVVMDVRMPGMSGIGALARMKEVDGRMPIIIMTAFGDTDTAIEATKRGAYDYILKPFEIPEVLGLIERALEAARMARTRVEMGPADYDESRESIIGQSAGMREVYKSIGRVAPTDATVLVRGESGTGKELVARAVYQHSPRADKPFLVINCVAIPETLLESELFGYEKGAFTGAGARKAGKIEQAHGGTVFLDEIGDMPMGIQAKILRLLQEKSVERLGGRDPIPVDVRIIAATNRDLEGAISAGAFREDLYYRLKVVTIELPPLRDRKDDIPLLADYFAARHAREMAIDNPGVSGDARLRLQAHHWPGNVRELDNAIYKALIFSRGCPIRPEDVSEAILDGDGKGPVPRDGIEAELVAWIKRAIVVGDSESVYNDLMDNFSARIVGQALALTGGNRSRAAKLLGLSRPTLQAKIEKHGLKMTTSVKSD